MIPKHTSRKAKRFLADQEWTIMQWPAQSPDLNPIEMLWIDVDKEIKRQRPKSKDQLFQVIQQAWNAIPGLRCRKLVESMKRRCREVIKNKGMATSY